MRIAVQSPLPCFGVEYDRKDEQCKKCEFELACIDACGFRAQRITLAEATFQILPERFAERVESRDPDEENLEELYRTSYQTVFGCEPHHRIERVPRAKEKILASCRELDCPLKLFILTVMMAHKKCAPESDFYPSMLLGDSAIQRVGRWRAACAKRYGTFNLGALDTLMDVKTSEKDLDNIMLGSEVEIATFIVGYKKWKSGKPFLAAFEQREMRLSPYWCAIDPHYFETVLKHHLKKPFGTVEQNRFRHNVAQTVGYLKRGKVRALPLFEARQRILPKAAGKVLEHFGFTPKDFEVEDKPVTDPLTFWSRLGLALQHLACLQHVENGESELARFMGKSHETEQLS